MRGRYAESCSTLFCRIPCFGALHCCLFFDLANWNPIVSVVDPIGRKGNFLHSHGNNDIPSIHRQVAENSAKQKPVNKILGLNGINIIL